MTRKLYSGIVTVLVCIVFGLLTSCGFSSRRVSPMDSPITTTVSGGSGQAQTVGEAFAHPLVARVSTNGTPTSGATVTFVVPLSGASCTPSATTATTDANGEVSITCTANSTAGAYSVTATTT